MGCARGSQSDGFPHELVTIVKPLERRPKVNSKHRPGPSGSVRARVRQRPPMPVLGAAAFLMAVGMGVGGGAAAFVALEGGPKACQDRFGGLGAEGELIHELQQSSPRPA